ncbi:MAG: hypothetical protein Q4G70_12020 [Pseudomonadota bacterium]|nr:hypothetical protein [Pseudomonadota bacterium]
MKSGFHGSDHVHPLGESAMHPITLRWPCHAALLVLAHTSAQRPRVLPGTPITARSGASNCHFQVESGVR